MTETELGKLPDSYAGGTDCAQFSDAGNAESVFGLGGQVGVADYDPTLNRGKGGYAPRHVTEANPECMAQQSLGCGKISKSHSNHTC
jgi:hypothetical protein